MCDCAILFVLINLSCNFKTLAIKYGQFGSNNPLKSLVFQEWAIKLDNLGFNLNRIIILLHMPMFCLYKPSWMLNKLELVKFRYATLLHFNEKMLGKIKIVLAPKRFPFYYFDAENYAVYVNSWPKPCVILGIESVKSVKLP